MTENERDPKVSEAYRALRGAEPPARLDDAILAASRRAVRAGPRRSALQRWTVPVSLAAAVVLSVMVTVRVQQERPDLEVPTAAPAPAQAPAPVAAKEPVAKATAVPAEQPAPMPVDAVKQASVVPLPAERNIGSRPGEAQRKQVIGVEARKPAAAPDVKRDVARDERQREAPRYVPDPAPRVAEGRAAPPPVAEVRSAPVAPASVAAAPAPAASAPPSPPAAPPVAAPAKPAPVARAAARQETGPGATAGTAQDALRDRADKNAVGELAKRAEADETPERQLERIATLRREGRHAEADKLLAEFRQRHPQYRIPEAMLERVQPPR